MMPAHQMVQAAHRTPPRGRPSTSPLRSVDPLLTGLSTRHPAVWARRNCTLSGAACSAGELRQRATWTVCPPLGPSDTYGIFLSRCEVLLRPLPFTRKQKKSNHCSPPVLQKLFCSFQLCSIDCCSWGRMLCPLPYCIRAQPYFPTDILMCLSVSGAWPRVHPIDCCSLLVFRAQGQHWQGQPGSRGDVLR